MKKLVAILLVFVLVCGLAACGGDSDDPNVGRWNAVSASMMGIEMEISQLFEGGVNLELKAGGKLTLDVDGEKGGGKWAYSGNDIKITADGVEMTDTVANGRLALTNLLGTGIDLTFEKEGGYPAASGSVAGGKAAGGPAYYVVERRLVRLHLPLHGGRRVGTA